MEALQSAERNIQAVLAISKSQDAAAAARALEPLMTLCGTSNVPVQTQRQLLDTARSALSRLVSAAHAALRTELDRTEAKFRRSIQEQNCMLSVAALAVMSLVLVAPRTLKEILQPLRFAVIMAERVAQGNLSESIPVNRSDEVGALQRALFEMNRALAASSRMFAGSRTAPAASRAKSHATSAISPIEPASSRRTSQRSQRTSIN